MVSVAPAEDKTESPPGSLTEVDYPVQTGKSRSELDRIGSFTEGYLIAGPNGVAKDRVCPQAFAEIPNCNNFDQCGLD
jgi:hypothetical protein